MIQFYSKLINVKIYWTVFTIDPYPSTSLMKIMEPKITKSKMNGNNNTNQEIPGAPALQIKFKTQVQKRM